MHNFDLFTELFWSCNCHREKPFVIKNSLSSKYLLPKQFVIKYSHFINKLNAFCNINHARIVSELP